MEYFQDPKLTRCIFIWLFKFQTCNIVFSGYFIGEVLYCRAYTFKYLELYIPKQLDRFKMRAFYSTA